MDNQTRRALKSDSFVSATASSISWMSGHRSSLIKWAAAVVALLLLLCVGLGVYGWRSSAANQALSSALDVYSAPLLAPGQPAVKGYYASAAERSKAANQKFVAAASQYGWTSEGARARYFAGVTYVELGQIATGEAELKSATGSWDRNLSNLAKLSLAGLYHRTGRDAQAAELLNAIVAKPSVTVTAQAAQLELAELAVAQGKQDQARLLWAKVKDADKDGAAGAIAAQKLGGN